MSIHNTDLGKRAQQFLNMNYKDWDKLTTSQDKLVKHYRELKAVMDGLANVYHGNAADTTKAEVLDILKVLTKVKKKSEREQRDLTSRFDPPKHAADDKIDPGFDLYESKTFDLKKFLIENKLTKNSKY